MLRRGNPIYNFVIYKGAMNNNKWEIMQIKDILIKEVDEKGKL